MKKIRTFSILLLLLCRISAGQEFLVPAGGNTVLQEVSKKRVLSDKSSTTPDTLELPFFDDFSLSDVYPDEEKWMDKGAYINSEMALRMISVGVATLDVLDSAGAMYSNAQANPFVSETLTSLPINLDPSAGSDIFLSFFYEPGGLVNEPEEADSLILEFRSPLTEDWEQVWSSTGFASDTFSQAILPITDARYLVKGFQFRFKNYASLTINDDMPEMTGNQDFWHLDYIYLDKDRSLSDTVYADVAFSAPGSTLLLNYESLPWSHFSSAKLQEMGDEIEITYRNNGDAITNVTRYFEITDQYTGSLVHSYTGGADNIEAREVLSYTSSLVYTFSSSSSDSALFEVKSYLNTDDPDYKGNDTLKYYQVFKDYYSYDDGSAEGGYLLNGEGTSTAMVALKYHAYASDSLQAIRIFFNRTYEDASVVDFTLAVWDDNNGIPGSIIYSQEGELPEYEETLNGFHLYTLDEPQLISGDFYVGWIQTSETSLNVGADYNRDHSDELFYYISQNGGWLNSSYEISLMIQPVFYSSLSVGNTILPESVEEPEIYPVPARDKLYIRSTDLSENEVISTGVYNSYGQCLRNYSGLPDEVNLSGFAPGLYFLRFLYSNRRITHQKFLIVK